MKYIINYQYLAKNAYRPTDDGEIVEIMADADSGDLVVIPNVGDYVHIDNSMDGGERASFSGKVRSRLFRYIRMGTASDAISCLVNIIVEENEEGWEKLIKE